MIFRIYYLIKFCINKPNIIRNEADTKPIIILKRAVNTFISVRKDSYFLSVSIAILSSFLSKLITSSEAFSASASSTPADLRALYKLAAIIVIINLINLIIENSITHNKIFSNKGAI